MENKKLKIIIIILSGIFLIASIGATIFVIKNHQKLKAKENTPENTNGVISPIKTQAETKIYFVGDIMLDRGVLSSVNKNFNGNFSELFKNVTELKNADILYTDVWVSMGQDLEKNQRLHEFKNYQINIDQMILNYIKL